MPAVGDIYKGMYEYIVLEVRGGLYLCEEQSGNWENFTINDLDDMKKISLEESVYDQSDLDEYIEHGVRPNNPLWKKK